MPSAESRRRKVRRERQSNRCCAAGRGTVCWLACAHAAWTVRLGGTLRPSFARSSSGPSYRARRTTLSRSIGTFVRTARASTAAGVQMYDRSRRQDTKRPLFKLFGKVCVESVKAGLLKW